MAGTRRLGFVVSAVAALTCFAVDASDSNISVHSKAELKARTSTALCSEAVLRKDLKLKSLGKVDAQYQQAVSQLCELYPLVIAHPGYERSPLLQQQQRTLKRRLTLIQKHLEGQLRWYDDAPAVTEAPQRRGGAAVAGWNLVELIQRTIKPKSWESQGGPGSIYFYPQGRALVVRATSVIHENVQDQLRNLQRQ